MKKFIAGMFKDRRPTPRVEEPRPEPVAAGVRARHEREQRAAEAVAERHREGVAVVERAIAAAGLYWPGDASVPENPLSGSSWRSRVVARVLAGLRGH